jgi:hypothetical protein
MRLPSFVVSHIFGFKLVVSQGFRRNEDGFHVFDRIVVGQVPENIDMLGRIAAGAREQMLETGKDRVLRFMLHESHLICDKGHYHIFKWIGKGLESVATLELALLKYAEVSGQF